MQIEDIILFGRPFSNAYWSPFKIIIPLVVKYFDARYPAKMLDYIIFLEFYSYYSNIVESPIWLY